MVHWQPRSIPATSYEAARFDTTAANSEEVLVVLDFLAMKYSAATVKCVLILVRL